MSDYDYQQAYILTDRVTKAPVGFFGRDGKEYLINFGASGSGVVIDGEVDTFGDLPSAVSHAGEVYLVKQSSGVWLINRKSGGLYLSDGATWSIIIDYDTLVTQINNNTTAIATKQDADADLSAIAALTGTNTIYYRSAANTWSAVTIGANLTFSAGTLAATGGGGGGLSDADYGDITVTGTGTVMTIDNGVVTNAKAANMAANTLKGNNTGSSAVSADLTVAQVKTLLNYTTTDIGAANASHTHTLSQVSDVTMTVANLNTLDDGANTTLHFHDSDRNRTNHTGTQAASTISDFSTAADARVAAAVGVTIQAFDADLSALAALSGTDTIYYRSGASAWSAVTIGANLTFTAGTLAASGGGGGVSDGDKGDITVTASGATWTVDNQAITYAKIQNVSATDKLLGRSTAGAGVIEEITLTAAGRALIDDADATAQRTTLGLGSAATATVTTSTTDTTAGRVVRVGDFAVGSAPIVSTNWDTVTATSRYTNTGTGDTGIPAATVGLVCNHIYIDANTAHQTALDISTGSMWVRAKASGTWGSWSAVSGGGGGSPAGSTTQIQFNSSGSFGASADLTYDDSTKTFTLGGTNTTSVMKGITTEPSSPSSGYLTQYVKAIAGRMMPKIKGPSGLDTAMQMALFQNRVLMYIPSTGTTGTGSGTSLGPVWTSGGTVNHPTPSSTAPAISNQMRRTRYANVVTTTNQTLGIKAAAADTLNFWRGNAAGLGGFFYSARFIVELWAASTCRIFAGLTASSATYVVASDTVLNNTCGLWHDTTDPNSGANSFNFVTRDTTTTTKQSIALSNAIAAGNSYDFYMFCPPNGSTIYWRLDDIVNGVTYEGSTSTTLPAATAFMGPQCAMSNGTANITVTTVAIGVAGVYTEADR